MVPARLLRIGGLAQRQPDAAVPRSQIEGDSGEVRSKGANRLDADLQSVHDGTEQHAAAFGEVECHSSIVL